MNESRILARAVRCVFLCSLVIVGPALAGWSDATTTELADLTLSHGVTWADYDNDGDFDIFLANGGTNRLFRNEGGGVFADVADSVGVDNAQVSSVGVWGDYDNDGDLDLYLSNTQGANHLYRNDPYTAGWQADPYRVFVDVTNSLVLGSTRATHGCTWIDYDLDGDLDLYLTDSSGNILLRNDGADPVEEGNWLFVDVTDDTGAGSSDDTQSAVWADYDGDGDQDLYVVNYEDADLLLRNDKAVPGDPDDTSRVFVDVAASVGLGDDGPARGAAWGDFDNDGDQDLYVTRYGDTNILYRNDGNVFTDITADTAVGDAGNGRHCTWVDFDNDADLDLHVVNYDNGTVTQDSRLYRNDGPDALRSEAWLFVEVADILLANDGTQGASAAWADFDDDGDLDVYLANWDDGSANTLIRNDMAVAHGHLYVDLTGKTSNTSAIGARVTVICGDTVQIREINGGEGFHSQNTLRAEFGLNDAAVVDTLRIAWPSGLESEYVDVAIDQTLAIEEPGPDAPTLVEEPLYTSGTTNSVFWSDESAGGATAYRVQASESTAFDVLVGDSGWTLATNWVFSGLSDGQTLYYRVRSRDAQSIESRWSDTVVSTQDDGFPESTVDPVDGPREALPFDVSFTASDGGSGVETVQLWYQFEGGAWQLFDTVGSDGSFIFDVPEGEGVYGFYSVAVDYLGNEETAPVAADVSVTTTTARWVNVAPTDGSDIGNDGNGRGAAWGDYDGDGSPDMFITNRPLWYTGSDATNHLFHNQGDGSFTDATVSPMDDGGYGQGVAWGDFDGDGDLDVYQSNMPVGSDAPNRLFRNDGGGAFTDIGPETGTDDVGSGRTVSWVDFDGDGDLDLYLCNNGRNRLYRNDGEDPWSPGDWVFTDVAPTDGSGVGDDRYTMGGAWADFDNDGDLDLYLTNYNGGANALLRNDGAGVGDAWIFTDVAAAMGVDDSASGLGAAWGDYDGDGWLDLYVTNQGTNRLYHRVAGSELFEDVTDLVGEGLDDGSYNTGCGWADYDNDGDLDLYVASHWTDQYDWVPNRLFRNDGEDLGSPGGWSFVNVASPLGYNIGSGANTTASVWGDYDGDGDLDLYLCNMTGTANELYRNDVPEAATNHWLHLDLASKSFNTCAIGARVRCVVGGASMIREVEGSSGFLSQPTLTVEYGLGSAAVADTVEITWPSGTVQTLTGVAADQRLSVTEPGPDAPVIAEFAAYTPADSLEIVWNDVSASSATAYLVQCGDGPDFETIVATSTWIADTTYVFTGLADGFEGYYRVRARDDDLHLSRWSATEVGVQDYSPPVSSVDPVVIPYQGLSFDVSCAAEDTISGVAEVQLWYRHESMGVYALYEGAAAGDTFFFDLPDGLGEYFFYSVAVDSVGNTEDAPAGYDQSVIVEASPWILVSSADGSGVGSDGNGRGAAWGDWDGDGDPDLYIANRVDYVSGADATNHLFRNDGPDGGDPDSWTFTDVTSSPLGDSGYGQGVAWADFDGDGDLDLYQVNMQVNQAYEAPNRLYRNDGGGVFVDIGEEAGLNDGGSGRSCSWRDFDGDGDADLYLCNSGANRLYRNDGEHPTIAGQWVFTNVAPEDGSGIGDDSYTMACAWADFDDDGDPDLYLSNFNNTANRLFRNDGEDPSSPGDWLWVDVAPSFGLDNDSSGTGCMWGDFDNDGRLDLFVCNNGPNALYHNVAAGGAPSDTEISIQQPLTNSAKADITFIDIAPLYDNGLADEQYGAGVAWFDFDNDGDLDLFQGNHWNTQADPAVNFLFRNDGPDPAEPEGWLFTNVAPTDGQSISDDSSTNGVSCADYDGDGDLDLYLATMNGLTNKLFRNDVADSTDNHWLHVDLTAMGLNTTAVGATLRATAGDLVLLREVDGGSGFLSQGSPTVEFGLGSATVVDSLLIRWPTGVQRLLLDVAVDQRLSIEQISTAVDDPAPDATLAFRVYPNYPNPFNPSTTLRFDLAKAGRTTLTIYALDGSLVRTLVNEDLPAGRNGAIWYGRNDRGQRVASGVYFWRVRTADHVETQRMMLVK